MVNSNGIPGVNNGKIGIGIIAIVGAFSADVVAIILKRIADILKITLTGAEDVANGQKNTEEDKQPT